MSSKLKRLEPGQQRRIEDLLEQNPSLSPETAIDRVAAGFGDPRLLQPEDGAHSFLDVIRSVSGDPSAVYGDGLGAPSQVAQYQTVSGRSFDNELQFGKDLLANTGQLGNGVAEGIGHVLFEGGALVVDFGDLVVKGATGIVTGDFENLALYSNTAQGIVAQGLSGGDVALQALISPITTPISLLKQGFTSIIEGKPEEFGFALGQGLAIYGAPAASRTLENALITNFGRNPKSQSFELFAQRYAESELGAKYVFDTQAANRNGFDFGYATTSADGGLNLFGVEVKSGYLDKFIPEKSFTSFGFGRRGVAQFETNVGRLTDAIRALDIPRFDKIELLSKVRSRDFSLQIVKAPEAKLRPDFISNLQIRTGQSVAPTISLNPSAIPFRSYAAPLLVPSFVVNPYDPNKSQ